MDYQALYSIRQRGYNSLEKTAIRKLNSILLEWYTVREASKVKYEKNWGRVENPPKVQISNLKIFRIQGRG